MHRDWEMRQWGKVAFSDESTFTLKPTSLRKRVWREQGECYRTFNMVPTFKSGFESISVWAAFFLKRRTPLIRIEGSLIKQSTSRYYKMNCFRSLKSILEAKTT